MTTWQGAGKLSGGVVMAPDLDADDRRALVDVATGRAPADLVVTNARWVCVQSGEILPRTDVAIKNGRIARVGGEAGQTVGKATRVLDAADRHLVPGLLDAHVHVESSMLTVSEFSRAVLPHGTTGAFIDPHEIANVFGLRGVRLMADEAAVQPIHIWVQVPSCVPSAPGLETPGAEIGPEDVAEALTWPGVIGLAEMMNYPGVIAGDPKVHAEMALARRAGKVVGGHYASPDLGLAFHGYVAGGPEDDHEGTRREDAVARVRQGMYAILRYGSAFHDVAAQVPAITDGGLDPRHVLLCCDDAHAETLLTEGHMDRALRHAIASGLPAMTAIQMATINTAEHFGVAREVGMIAPGRWADIILVGELDAFEVEAVLARGELVAENGRVLIPRKPYPYPSWATSSVRTRRAFTPSDFALRPGKAQAKGGNVVASIISLVPNQAQTRHVRLEVAIAGGEVRPDIARDIAKIAVAERHHGSGRLQVGLVHGFGFTLPCAVASTVAHDCHQMVVVGTDEGAMARAANELARVGGGQVVVREGDVVACLQLPIAGLMSADPAETVARGAAQVLAAFRACGCELASPNMPLSLLALVVIPELRLSDLGLVDVTKFEFIPVLGQ